MISSFLFMMCSVCTRIKIKIKKFREQEKKKKKEGVKSCHINEKLLHFYESGVASHGTTYNIDSMRKQKSHT